MLGALHRALLGLAVFLVMSIGSLAFAAKAELPAKPTATKTGKAKSKAKSAVKKGKSADAENKAAAAKGKRAQAGKAAKTARASAPAVKRRIPKGTMTLRILNTRDKVEGLRVVEVSKKGKREVARLTAKGKKKLAWLLRDSRNGKVRRPPDRLLYQLYQVQQHFDAPIDVVSGYRGWARKTSRHFKGWAVDFKVEGVDPRVVWNFCKQFKEVGCGHYPTSGFVHMDIRDKSYSWIDMSGPGEPARYVKEQTAGAPKETAEAAPEAEE
ncbi:DUF882 domain-containing protein [Myxococcota bacterium]|jgi:uncharacterized protein YcbK (DUF882 family)|nr:DUF882 domain-containing protein [Myxococcota bacterium]